MCHTFDLIVKLGVKFICNCIVSAKEWLVPVNKYFIILTQSVKGNEKENEQEGSIIWICTS